MHMIPFVRPVRLRAPILGAILSLGLLHAPLLAQGGANGVTELVSLDPAGVPLTEHSLGMELSADGRWVAYHTSAAPLAADTNGASDVYAYDRQTGAVLGVSTTAAGAYPNGPSFSPSLSADGRFAAFESFASDLVPLDFNADQDIFVKDLLTGAIERVTNTFGGASAANGRSSGPELSADGRYVTFASGATDLVPGDTNGQGDIFRHDRFTGAIELVSSGPAGQGDGYCSKPAISADGSRIAFESWSTNLVPGDLNDAQDVFVVDVGGLPQLASRTPAGGPGNSQSSAPVTSLLWLDCSPCRSLACS